MKKINLSSLGFYPNVQGRCPNAALVSVQQKLPQLRQSSLSELCDVFGKWVPVGGELAIKLPREVDKALGSVSANRSYSAKFAVRDRFPPLLPA